MNSIVYTKSYEAPPVNRREILRYAGCAEAEEAVMSLLEKCLAEASAVLSYRVCFQVLDVTLSNTVCDLGPIALPSGDLAKNLSGCSRAILFAATVGVGMDRLIHKYSHVAPAQALMMQAIGAERIEALCDAFCAEQEREMGVSLRPRFSPGYGDLPLQHQRDIVTLLDTSRRIGLSLNDSLMMSPTKSVTAFAGITNIT